MTNPLLTPFDRDGLLATRNRTVMSAMTRGFADADHCATPAMVEYYRKRAAGGCGLILTEGVVIHPSGDGYKDVPRIATDAQAESWRPVVDGVHAEGGKIALQLWHCGRISHEDFTDGNQPVSSTAQVAAGQREAVAQAIRPSAMRTMRSARLATVSSCVMTSSPAPAAAA